MYEAHKDEFNVARVDCTTDDAKELCSQFEVRGFPSLILFDKTQKYAYKQKRDLATLATFAQGGYKDSKPEDISDFQIRLEGFAKLQKEMSGFSDQLVKLINKAFDSAGLTFIP